MRNLVFIVVILLLLLVCIALLFMKKKPIRLRLTAAAVSLAAAVLAAVLWCFPSWTPPDPTGPYGVATTVVRYVDESRTDPYAKDGSRRWLNVEFWYPQNHEETGRCPLVLFSHGSFGIRESNETLYRELASHGYVVAAADHTYQCLRTKAADGTAVRMDKGYRNEILSASDKTPESRETLRGLFAKWMDIRMGDLGFVLDTAISFASLEDGGTEEVYRLIDVSKIGVVGHSLGGSAALGVGRTRDDVSAVVALEAPFMFDVTGVDAEGFLWDPSPYPVPLLSVYTDSLWDRLAVSPQYAQNNTVLHDGLDYTYHRYLKGAGHMTLTDLAYTMPPLCLAFGQDLFLDAGACVKELNRTCLLFFDCYLKDGAGFYHDYTSD